MPKKNKKHQAAKEAENQLADEQLEDVSGGRLVRVIGQKATKSSGMKMSNGDESGAAGGITSTSKAPFKQLGDFTEYKTDNLDIA